MCARTSVEGAIRQPTRVQKCRRCDVISDVNAIDRLPVHKMTLPYYRMIATSPFFRFHLTTAKAETD